MRRFRLPLATLVALLGAGPGAQESIQLGQAPRRLAEPASAAAAPQVLAQGVAVDRHDRSAVAALYLSLYVPQGSVPAHWTGSLAGCNAGDTDTAFQEAARQRVNFYRAMTGLPGDVVFDALLHTKCQEAAEMMIAEGALSHFPPPTWACYTPAGAEAAASSNLALGLSGPAAIEGFMRDDGAGNSAAGHRRWILYPRQMTMATGDTTAVNGPFHGSSALWVLGPAAPRPTAPAFVAWPPDGFVPYQLVFPRWSFSLNRPGSEVSFQSASVSVVQGGSPVALTLEPVADGFGDDTVVWVPQGIPSGPPSQDLVFTVTVSDVLVNGAPESFQYTTTIFDPATAPPPSSTHGISVR